jgi:hypothetical protein
LIKFQHSKSNPNLYSNTRYIKNFTKNPEFNLYSKEVAKKNTSRSKAQLKKILFDTTEPDQKGEPEVKRMFSLRYPKSKSQKRREEQLLKKSTPNCKLITPSIGNFPDLFATTEPN